MAYWRRIGVVGVAMAMWVLCGGVVSTHGNRDRDRDRGPRLSIGGYQLVRVEKINKNVRQYTYRARLKNRGGAAVGGARAVLIRKHGDFQMVDAELSFGPVRPHSSVPSVDTFSFRHHGPQGLPGHGEYLRWQITAAAGNRAPIANAGPDASMAIGQRARLDGSRSNDPDGDPLTYRWAFSSKPAASRAELTGADTATPSFTIDAPGSFVVGLTVEDGQAASANDAAVVSTPNTAPVANAGPDQTVTLGERAQLSGAASNDGDGDALTYRWRLESRPAGSVATLGGLSGVESSLVPDVPGRYVVQLTVNDGRIDSAPDAVIISTANSAPVARAGADQGAAVGDVVRLDGSASSDVDGDALRFAWTLVSRPAGSAATALPASAVAPSVTIDRAGIYRFRLIVNDGAVSSAAGRRRDQHPQHRAGGQRRSGRRRQPRRDRRARRQRFDRRGRRRADLCLVAHQPAVGQRGGDRRRHRRVAALHHRSGRHLRGAADRLGRHGAERGRHRGGDDAQHGAGRARRAPTRPRSPGSACRSTAAPRAIPTARRSRSNGRSRPGPRAARAVLQNPTSSAPWFIADRDGIYVAQLIVSDGVLSSSPDTVSISTTNAAPAANAGVDRLDVPVGSMVALDGSASADPDGQTADVSLVARGGAGRQRGGVVGSRRGDADVCRRPGG